jgi:hypothetical protein
VRVIIIAVVEKYMRTRFQVSLACFAILLSLAAQTPAAADKLGDFNAAVEKAAAHQRVAIGYLHTGNIDLAAVEIEHMRTAWGAVTSLKRPAALNRDPQLYTTTMLDVSTRLVAAQIMVDSGRPDAARQSLEAVRAELHALRKANGIVVLADCIGDANAAMDRLMTFNDRALDWSTDAAAVSNGAAAYRTAIDQCDAMAAADIRASGEFRRLVDGARNSLSQVPKAVADRDTDLLHRLLIELRAFDNLLAFRYG